MQIQYFIQIEISMNDIHIHDETGLDQSNTKIKSKLHVKSYIHHVIWSNIINSSKFNYSIDPVFSK